MKITDIRATTVTVPLEAPLRHSNGAHWGRFVRTIVEVDTDEGLTGVGEMGGGGESARERDQGAKALSRRPRSAAARAAALEDHESGGARSTTTGCSCTPRSSSPASTWPANSSNIRACDLLGGALREEVPFATYLFYRYRDPKTGAAARSRPTRSSRTPKTWSNDARLQDAQAQGRRSFRPITTSKCFARSARHSPKRRPAARSQQRRGASRRRSASAKAIGDLNNDYFEDPTWGLGGHAPAAAGRSNIPTATNTVVVNFEQLAACIRTEAIDVDPPRHDVLGRPSPGLQGGAGARDVPAGACRPFLRRARHPARDDAASRRGAAQSRLRGRRALPPPDRRHHQGRQDDQYVDGKIALPKGPGLGVELDRDKLAEYAELYKELGGYTYDRDPGPARLVRDHARAPLRRPEGRRGDSLVSPAAKRSLFFVTA